MPEAVADVLTRFRDVVAEHGTSLLLRPVTVLSHELDISEQEAAALQRAVAVSRMSDAFPGLVGPESSEEEQQGVRIPSSDPLPAAIRLAEHPQLTTDAAVPTGFDAIDDALLGGLPVGSVTELLGGSGGGKTTAAAAIACGALLQAVNWSDVIAGDPSTGVSSSCAVLWFDVDSTLSADGLAAVLSSRIAARLQREGASNEAIHGIVDDMVPLLLERVTVIDTVRTLDDFTSKRQAMELAIVSSQARLVVVDSFATAVKRSFSGLPEERPERHSAVSAAISALKESCGVLRCAALLVNHQAGAAPVGPGFGQRGNPDGAGLFGVAFQHAVNTRFAVSQQSGSLKRWRGVLSVVKSPVCGAVSVEF